MWLDINGGFMVDSSMKGFFRIPCLTLPKATREKIVGMIKDPLENDQ